MKTNKIQLMRDDTRGAAYGYRPLIDFILEKGGVVGNWAPQEEYPFHTNKTETYCQLYSDVSYDDVLDAFGFDEGVWVREGMDGKFTLSDDKRRLRIVFDSHEAHALKKQDDSESAAKRAKEKAVLEMKLQAAETSNPQASKPKGRLRISVKPWRDAREAYYPVIEYAIAQGCTIDRVEGQQDQYFEPNGEGAYLCMIRGPLSAHALLTEFSFGDEVLTPDADAPSGYAIFDKENGISIWVLERESA